MSASPSSQNAPVGSELATVRDELKPLVTRIGLLCAAGSALELLPMLYMFQVYDRVVNSRDVTTLVLLSLLLLLGLAAAEFLDYLGHGLQKAAAGHLDRRLSLRVTEASFQATLNRSPPQANAALPDLRTLREFLLSPTIETIVEVPTAIPFLIILWVMDPWLLLAALVGLGLTTVLTFNTERRIHPTLTEARGLADYSQRYFSSNVQFPGAMAAMGMEPAIRKRWTEHQWKFLKQQALASESAARSSAVSRLVGLTQSSALMGIGAWLFIHFNLGNGGLVIMASMLGARALAPLSKLVSSWKSVVGARDAYARLDGFLAACPAPAKNMPLPAPTGVLAVESLTAAAPGTNVPILRGLSFRLAAGETLAVIGPSGSGKSSLLRLLVGAWRPAAGSVRLDGVEVSQWDKAELGPHVGYLSQEIELFEGSIADNISRFAPDSPERQVGVEVAVAAAGLSGFIKELPDGLATRVGPAGTFLSGGQRQKVGLARALYGNPALVVLDEPNSSLDQEGERALSETLRGVKAAGKTLVLVSHRTSLLQLADKVLVLVEGQARLFGPRDEVMSALAGNPPAAAARGVR